MPERVLYSEQRPYLAAETLDELAGPTNGIVTLPTRLDWSEQRKYNLDDPRELCLMYERVLREALTAADLRGYLNGAMLQQVWPRLFLPRRVCELWELRFAELTRAA
ncbi:MAG TPA: hypothetical protein VHC49_07940 [Mycobacteriales bacterium]|nr:hypothetical protein [Mycobacteriales bacterium]